jgi:hypothetical protein
MSEQSRRDFLKTGAMFGLSAYLLGNAELFAFGQTKADLILTNGKIATQDERRSFAQAVAVKDGRFLTVGSEKDVMRFRGAKTQIVNLNKRTVIPGLNDSHSHPIRGGLNYNMELRWDGVNSLADGLAMLKIQARNTPPPQWVRVVGGWSEFQFKERRMPTLDEINAAAPDTPVFILHLYVQAMLNKAALQALGFTKDTPDPPGGVLERDKNGNPTGLLLAKPNPSILYANLAKGPLLSREDQINSTLHFMRELNRLGITSCCDAGGGGQAYPTNYDVIEQLNRENKLTVRLAYSIFSQKPKEELRELMSVREMVKMGAGNDFYRMNGAGEMLVYSAGDFEDFLEPRPTPAPIMEADLKKVVRWLAENKWAFRMHATYDETIERVLNAYEEVNREVPLSNSRWFIDHAETISDKNIERIKRLGGGIAVQNRMSFQGEYFLNRYGKEQTKRTPPIKRMLETEVPVGAGTDATRVSSYSPWVSLHWLVTGKTLGGLQMYDERNRLDRMEALRLWTVGSSWFSGEAGKKGAIQAGQFADLAVLSKDYFSVPEEEIKAIESVLTIVDGKVVHGAQEFQKLAPALPPVSPSWSPVKTFGGAKAHRSANTIATHNCSTAHFCGSETLIKGEAGLWRLGCDCYA